VQGRNREDGLLSERFVAPSGNDTVRFGTFEADLRLGEVRKSGNRIKLQEQSFKILQVRWTWRLWLWQAAHSNSTNGKIDSTSGQFIH
jgi:hypothetical protein